MVDFQRSKCRGIANRSKEGFPDSKSMMKECPTHSTQVLGNECAFSGRCIYDHSRQRCPIIPMAEWNSKSSVLLFSCHTRQDDGRYG
eukprot:scaffold363_cov331-Pavlova_lutheri.AAC.25